MITLLTNREPAVVYVAFSIASECHKHLTATRQGTITASNEGIVPPFGCAAILPPRGTVSHNNIMILKSDQYDCNFVIMLIVVSHVVNPPTLFKCNSFPVFIIVTEYFIFMQ